MERVAIFCDSANIYHGTTRYFPAERIDQRKLFEKIVGPDWRLLRVYWYMAVPVTEPQARDSQRFISYLQGVPYVEVRHKKLAAYQDGGVTRYREKGVDVWLATDMVNMAHKGIYDVAALVSGDADLVPAVVGVKDAGRHVENYYMTGSQSTELRQQVDLSVCLDRAWLADALLTMT